MGESRKSKFLNQLFLWWNLKSQGNKGSGDLQLEPAIRELNQLERVVWDPLF